MNDDEILTQRLTDWKPETDIKLQKALGKFVEETGELLEASFNFEFNLSNSTVPFENELADCLAFIRVLELVSDGRIDTNFYNMKHYLDPSRTLDQKYNHFLLVHAAGGALAIIGRCQIQGLDKNQPDRPIPNKDVLSRKLAYLQTIIEYIIQLVALDGPRIDKRKQAKIDSKLPWVLGTATDLLPDI